MKSLIHIVGCFTLILLSASCSDVKFKSDKGNGGAGQNCQGASCPPGSFSWFESGFNICSKPCGGGTETQTVECRRNSDNVAVPDSNCTGTKPDASRACNVQSCTATFTWNHGPFGTCSKTCGGGTRTRTVVCQDQSGATVADSNCSAASKPAASEPCNPDPCPPVNPAWHVTPGTCSKPCGGGTATDVVVCRSADGTTVADSFCSSTTKPPTTRTCNPQTCPVTYTYAWERAAWSTCSKTCGDGIQTRAVTCKRSDGAYVAESFCTAAKPATQQACKIADCPTGRSVTQTVTVTPALNSVDVVLIIDDSGSMKADQAKLASRMAGLLTDLDALNIDYQVCLTTTDINHYKGAPIRWKGPNTYIMNKATPNKNQVFINTIDSLGAEWSSDEQGIKATYLMIKDWRSTGCLRNAATLTTILVSDENERSVGGNQAWSTAQYRALTPENMPDTLINFVRTTFGTAKKFIWNSIIVKPGDAQCEAIQDAQSSPSFFGTLYAELSNKTGGHVGSICDNDYSNNLSYIKDRTVNKMPGITMECTPIDTPVVTFVPAVTTSITVTGNQIKFSPALNEGVKVTAKYTCPN